MPMFAHVEAAPPDPILGLTEAFRADDRPGKINLGVGVYKDAEGRTPVLDVVKEAERHLVAEETTKSYLPIDGDPAYGRFVRELCFGAASPLVDDGRAVTVDAPGGTGALRAAGDLLARVRPDVTVWLSDPTWANHPQIFGAARCSVATYAYFDASSNALDFDAMTASLAAVPEGDAVLLHGCCHNPTGVDPTPAQWREIATLLSARGLLPVVDIAYQGLGRGLDEDAGGLRTLAETCDELLVCSSFSKNFGLYNERVGALTIVAADATTATTVLSQAKQLVRANWSNPPAHGAAIVTTVLGDEALRTRWYDELAAMRDRIAAMRRLFVDALAARGVTRDLSYLVEQLGMFSFSGLDATAVARLRDEFAVYIVGSGRINVAGMTPDNMDRLADAVAAVWSLDG
jgi:aspartate aminotransferase